MTEQARQKFADEILRQGRDWSFRWVGGQKVFTDAAVQADLSNIEGHKLARLAGKGGKP